MISDPESIYYACIARSSTILGHHQKEEDPNMEALASKCVAQAPPNHSLFSHTVNNRTYTFLIDPPFVFFAIFHHNLLKSQTLPFLHRLRSSFHKTLSLSSSSNHQFTPLSFQSQFHSIFHDALDNTTANTNKNDDASPDNTNNNPHNNTSSPPPPLPKPPQACLKKKQKRMLGISDDVVSLKPLDRQKAKHVWKKHVWVVLLLDLFVCAVLFVIWLWVCSGFKCMAY